jgi:TonB family protein
MMNDLFSYSVESAVCLTILTLFYYFFLRKETFFGINRFFLLFSLLYSLIIPFLNINYGYNTPVDADTGSVLNAAIQNVETIKNGVIRLDPVVISAEKSGLNIALSEVLIYAYLLGVFIHLVLFFIRFGKLFRTIMNAEKQRDGKYCYLKIPDHYDQVYSFFRFIFVGKGKQHQKEYKEIIEHEKSHVKLYHSIDLVLVELLIVLQWFNPFIYLLRKMVVENHEYQADSSVVRSSANKGNYLKLILDHVLNNQYFKMTSAFSYSLSKKRLKMLTKVKSSNKLSIAKIIAVVPLALILFFFFACSKSIDNNDLKKEKEKVTFNQLTDNDLGTVVPEELVKDYRADFQNKGEEILYELYAEFEGDNFPQTKIQLEKNVTYGFHLYSYKKGDPGSYMQKDSRSYMELIEPDGKSIMSTEKTVKEGNSEQHIYVDMQTKSGPGIFSVKDDNNKENKVVVVMTKAESFAVKADEEEDVFIVVEEMPVYDKQGDISDFREDIMHNIEYPEEARKENIEGTVYISFVVNKEGDIVDKKFARRNHPLLDQAAMEAFDGMANWEPGKQNGKPVKVKFTIPIVFRLK